MSEEKAQMAEDKATPKAAQAKASTVDAPRKSGEEFRKEWADANGVDPSEMHEIHYPGGWVDRFDGNGWVQGGGY